MGYGNNQREMIRNHHDGETFHSCIRETLGNIKRNYFRYNMELTL